MARISTYALDAAINDADKLIGTDSDNNNQTKNFSLLGIADYVIDKLIDPDATDFHIPVFNQDGIRITDSIMHQDSSVSNGTAGALITIDGNLLVNENATVYLNLSVAGESYLLGNVYLGTTQSDAIKQRGTLELLAQIKDSSGTLGNNEQVLVSDAVGKLHWENYQGSGLEFQSAWDPATNTPDLTAIPLIGDNTGKYWVSSGPGNTDLGGITNWNPGDWAIVSQDNDDNVFWSKIANSGLEGGGTPNTLTKWTSSTTLGDSIVSELGTLLTINGNAEVTGELDVAGAVRLGFTGNDPVILGNPAGKRTEWNNPGYFEIYAENPDVPGDFNETIDIDGEFLGGGYIGVYPVRTEDKHGVRMHSRDSGGIEANFIDIASVESSAVYDEDQIRIITTAGSSGTYAGIKIIHPTDNRFRFNSDFNVEPTVPFLVNTSAKFTGQVTIPITPTANTDAASKGYVDLQNQSQLTGTGNVYFGAMFDGTGFGASGSRLIKSSPLSFRITDTGSGVAQPHSLAFGGFSSAFGARNSVALGYNLASTGESSFATGHNTTASGKHAASFNYSTVASGEKSAAFGSDSDATGQVTFAIGTQNTAATSLSFAGGKYSTANPDTNFETAFAYGDSVSSTGNNSAAFGKNTEASGERSFAAGNNNDVQGDNAAAFGANNVVQGVNSIALGQGNTTNQSNSIAIGQINGTAGYPNVIAIGYGLVGNAAEQVVVGKYNSLSSARFVVGTGSPADGKNGLEVSNLNVTIPKYGSGEVEGTAAYNLAVDSNGKIIETPSSGAPDYLSFVCLLSQSGSADPQPDIVLENSLGIASPFSAFTRVASGEYNLTATGKFKLFKTIVFINGGSAENNHDVAWEVIDADNLRIRTHNSDGKLTKASLEIRTYN